MASIAGKRVAVNFQIMQKMLQGTARSGSEFLSGIVESEKNAAVIPASERQATKAQPHFARLRRGMQRHSLWRQCADGLQRGPRLIEESCRRAMRGEPGIQLARAPGIDLFADVHGGVMDVQLHGDVRVE